jgi:hypothetical protein
MQVSDSGRLFSPVAETGDIGKALLCLAIVCRGGNKSNSPLISSKEATKSFIANDVSTLRKECEQRVTLTLAIQSLIASLLARRTRHGRNYLLAVGLDSIYHTAVDQIILSITRTASGEPPSRATNPLFSIRFFIMLDSYLAVIMVNRNSGSPAWGDGVVWPELEGVAGTEVDGDVFADVEGTSVKVQRPNAQLRIYLERALGTSKLELAVASDDLGGVDA